MAEVCTNPFGQGQPLFGSHGSPIRYSRPLSTDSGCELEYSSSDSAYSTVTSCTSDLVRPQLETLLSRVAEQADEPQPTVTPSTSDPVCPRLKSPLSGEAESEHADEPPPPPPPPLGDDAQRAEAVPQPVTSAQTATQPADTSNERR